MKTRGTGGCGAATCGASVGNGANASSTGPGASGPTKLGSRMSGIVIITPAAACYGAYGLVP